MIYCVSDMHGEYDMTLKLLDEISFSDSDTLIVCGDIIDKGRQSVKLADFIFSLENAICIKGNHELSFLNKYHALTNTDGCDYDTVLNELSAYFPYDGQLLDWNTVDNFDTMLDYYEGDDFLCVHAGAPVDGDGKVLPIKSARIEQLVCDRNFKEASLKVEYDKCVLFGHTPTCASGGDFSIRKYPRSPHLKDSENIKDFSRVHLDTGVYLTNVLGCFCIDNCRCYYVKR